MGKEWLNSSVSSYGRPVCHSNLKSNATSELVLFPLFDTALGTFLILSNLFSVKGDVGAMGGSMSHEFHLTSHIGEDFLVICSE